MSDNISFTETDIPTVTRVSAPNPFDGRFPADDKALVTTVNAASDSTDVKRLVSQARKAAKAVERTARVTVVQEGTKAKPVTKVTVWTVPPIFRPRSADAAAAETAAE